MDMSAVYSWLPNERPKATQAIQEASELLEKNKGIIRKLGLQLLQVLGDDHKINGRYQAAEETYLSLLSRYQTTPVDADLQLMFAYDALGWVQMRLGDLEKAEVNLRRALQMAVASYGARSSLTLRSKVTLAEVLSKLGRSEEAEVLCAQLVDQLNQNHISGVSLPKDSISQLNALAQIFKTRGDHKGAKDAYAVVVEDRRKIFGNEHPMTLWAAAQLAASQRAAGEILEAQDAFIKLLPLQEKVLGSEHPDLKETRRHLQELETITG
jgi:tetratricopeptide (TPR) repeat protein